MSALVVTAGPGGTTAPLRTSGAVPAVVTPVLATWPFFARLATAGSRHVVAGFPGPAVAPVGTALPEEAFRAD